MDLYSVLSLPRTATAGEIDRAYRRLARRYHPGINPGDPVAAEMYRQIEEAYRVLSDAERRRAYDQGAFDPRRSTQTVVSFSGFDFTAPAEGPRAATFSELFAGVFQEAAREAVAPSRGAAIEATLSLSFEDAIRGGRIPVEVKRQDRCSTCTGAGHVSRPAVPCAVCGGQGTRRWARGYMVFSSPCESCGGSGFVAVQGCQACGGVGVQVRSEVVAVDVPPGVDDGARLLVPGGGHAGARGGPAGDLYVTVSVGSHPYLRREGRDLVLRLPVAVHEAALGAKIEVRLFDGPLQLRIPPGVAAGQRLRVSGRGVPATTPDGPAGDLWVELAVVLPPVRDERSKELLREFARLNDVDVRAHMRM